MASREDMEKALRAADAAGDTDSATRIAQAMKSQGGFRKGFFDVARGAASGMTFGYSDEIAAGLYSMAGKGTYEENLAQERTRNEASDPWLSIPGEIAGGITTAVAGAPYAAATKVGQLFTKLPSWLQTTGLGSLWGGLYGSGIAEEGERLESAAMGAGIGAATGGVLHGAGAGVKAATTAGRNFLQSRVDPQRAANRVIGETLREDQITPARVYQRFRDLGPKAALVDAAGPSTVRLARGLTGTPGAPATRISGMLEQRAAGESARVSKEVTQGLAPGDYFASEQAFLEKLKTGAKEAYGKAYEAFPVIEPSRRLDAILQSPVGKKALAEAKFIAETERAAGDVSWLGPVDKELTDLARYTAELGIGEKVQRPGIAKGLSLETWDYVKRGIDSLLDKPAYRNELTGNLNKKGHAVNSLRKSLTRALDHATGGEKGLYAGARKLYAGDAEVLTAIRDGAQFFKLSPEAIKAKMTKMSDAAKEAYRNGGARAILDIVEKTPDTATVTRRLMGNQMSRQKIQAIWPTKTFGRFKKSSIAEQRMTRVAQDIGAGSRTAPMAQDIASVQKSVGNLGAIVGSSIPTGGHALVKAGIGRRMMESMVGAPEEMNKLIARMLTTRNPAEQARILEMIAPYVKQLSKKRPVTRGLLMGGAQNPEVPATAGYGLLNM